MNFKALTLLSLYLFFSPPTLAIELRCPDGSFFYQEVNLCIACPEPCATCNSTSTGCQTCRLVTQFIDVVTNRQCKFCSDDQYFDTNSESCSDCGSSCEGECKFRAECLACPEGEILDLNALECMPSSNQDGQLLTAEMPGIGVTYLRDPTLFVDSTSASTVELGTMEHPYKTMDAPLHEIYAFFSGFVDVNFTVLIREGTTAILHSQASILQAQIMTITSYSTTSDTAGKATMEF